MANDDLTEPPTQKLTPFEKKVLARFDDLTATLATFQHDTTERLEKLESKALDTKPIWERALAEILEVKSDLVEVKDRLQRVEGSLGILAEDVVKVRADLQGFNRRIIALEKS